MTIFVLHHYWDTPDNEGNEILGVYYDKEHAQSQMRSQAAVLKEEFSPDVWDEDYTWENEDEIHLGFDTKLPYSGLTIYCWKIVEMGVQ